MLTVRVYPATGKAVAEPKGADPIYSSSTRIQGYEKIGQQEALDYMVKEAKAAGANGLSGFVGRVVYERYPTIDYYEFEGFAIKISK